MLVACSEEEQPKFYNSLLGEWHPLTENVNYLHLGHYPPTFNFLPDGQLAIDSIYKFFQDGLGRSETWINVPPGWILWSLSDSMIVFTYKYDARSIFDLQHTSYNSFLNINPEVEILDLCKNSIYLKFIYIDQLNLETSRTWEYIKYD